MGRKVVENLLTVQGISVDEETLAAVERWYQAWAREWQSVRDLDLAETPPAPLWCWPP